MFVECSNKEQCKRNLVKTGSYSDRVGRIFICENCKKYYTKINDNIIHVFFKNGKWFQEISF